MTDWLAVGNGWRNLFLLSCVAQALALGLVDKLGSSSYVAREVIGAKEIVDYTQQDTPFDRFAKKLGASVAEHVAIWAGFSGLTLR